MTALLGWREPAQALIELCLTSNEAWVGNHIEVHPWKTMIGRDTNVSARYFVETAEADAATQCLPGDGRSPGP